MLKHKYLDNSDIDSVNDNVTILVLNQNSRFFKSKWLYYSQHYLKYIKDIKETLDDLGLSTAYSKSMGEMLLFTIEQQLFFFIDREARITIKDKKVTNFEVNRINNTPSKFKFLNNYESPQIFRTR